MWLCFPRFGSHSERSGSATAGASRRSLDCDPNLAALPPRMRAVSGILRTAERRLLERDQELAAVTRAIDHTASGGAGLIIFEGPAGIGKSRLVAETATARGRARARSSSPRAAASSSATSRSASFASSSRRTSPTSACARASSRAPLRRRPPIFGLVDATTGGARKPGRGHLRGTARPVLARPQPLRGAAAGARRRRSALVRPSLAAVPRVPRAATRRRARPARRQPAPVGAGRRRGPARRADQRSQRAADRAGAS